MVISICVCALARACLCLSSFISTAHRWFMLHTSSMAVAVAYGWSSSARVATWRGALTTPLVWCFPRILIHLSLELRFLVLQSSLSEKSECRFWILRHGGQQHFPQRRSTKSAMCFLSLIFTVRESQSVCFGWLLVHFRRRWYSTAMWFSTKQFFFRIDFCTRQSTTIQDMQIHSHISDQPDVHWVGFSFLNQQTSLYTRCGLLL